MPNNSALVSQSFPASVAPGSAFTATVRLQNTGDTTWFANGPNASQPGYRLGASSPRDNYTWTTAPNNRFSPPNDVAPGTEVEVTLSLVAPAAAGVYSCRWEMVQEFVQWFGVVAGADIAVGSVAPPPPPPPAPPPFTLSTLAFVGAPADPNDLASATVIDTDKYYMDSIQYRKRWTNNTGRDLLVRKVYLWTGVDFGSVADVHLEAYRVSDGSRFGFVQWDRYADPTTEQGRQFDFAPYMRLNAGDSLEILHYANVIPNKGNTGNFAHHRLAFWAQFAPEIG